MMVLGGMNGVLGLVAQVARELWTVCTLSKVRLKRVEPLLVHLAEGAGGIECISLDVVPLGHLN